MKLTIVGCTGSFPGPGSPASCYLLTANDGERTWKIVMDLGSGALGAIQRYTDLEDIDAIFLTHLHPDHCMDLCGLHVAVRWKPGGWGRGRIPVWGPAATADRMATAYGLDLDPGMHEEFDFTNWTEREARHRGPLHRDAVRGQPSGGGGLRPPRGRHRTGQGRQPGQPRPDAIRGTRTPVRAWRRPPRTRTCSSVKPLLRKAATTPSRMCT